MFTNKKENIDWLLLLLIVLLIGIGWLAIYTADFNAKYPSIVDSTRSYGRQFQWIGFSLLIGFFIQLLDTRFFKIFAYPIYLSAIGLLIMVLIIGATISGSQSWFKLGGANLQPSEIAKYATALALAKWVSTTEIQLDSWREQIFTAGIIALPTLAVLLQGDTGSALVFTSFALPLYREGLSCIVLVFAVFMASMFLLALLVNFDIILGIFATIVLLVLGYREKVTQTDMFTYIIGSVAMILLSHVVSQTTFLLIFFLISTIVGLMYFGTKRLVFFLLLFTFATGMYVKSVDYTYNNVLKPHQKNRIGVILGKIEDKKGVGYNLNQSKIAIGSGGVWGKGFLHGTQNKGNFVPEIHTDFIFCTIGEEFGFVGSAVFISLFVFLLVRIVSIAERQRSRFSRIYAYSIASILFFHFGVNIAMTIGLMPVIGIPLPFISYGGSSLLGFSLMVFTLLKLDTERNAYV